MNIMQIQQEREIVHKVAQFLKDAGPFVSAAEASRITGVPLPTLSEAIRDGRVPALRVQSRRWLVRVSAVRSYFSHEEPADLALQKQLFAAGLLIEVRSQQRFEDFEPLPFEGKPASQILIEERR